MKGTVVAACVVALVAMVVVGCGARQALPGPASYAGFPNSIVVGCADWYTPGEIQAVMVAAAADHQTGFTMQETLAQVLWGCDGSPREQTCLMCGTAIVGWEYGH